MLSIGIGILDFKKYNKVFFKTIIALLGVFVALNYLVNPYNIFKQRVFPNHLLKPEAKLQERTTKPIGMKIDSRKIDSVFVGTSRVDYALDRAHFRKITGKEAENMAIGGLHFNELFQMIDISLKTHPEIKNVYVGLAYEVFLKNGESVFDNRADITDKPELDSKETGVALLCMKTTANSIWTVIKNFTGIKKRMFYSSGKKYIFVNKKINKEFEKMWTSYGESGAQELDPEKVKALQKKYDELKAKGVEVTFFVMPTHASRLYLIKKTGNWNTYARWKKSIVSIAPVYDFQYPNVYTTEAIKPDMQTFFDPSHSTYIVGNKIIEDVVQGKGNFARYVTAENVDRYNRLNLSEILKWEKQHSDVVDWINQTIGKDDNAI